MWWILLIVLIIASEFIMVVGELILKINERYSFGRRTKEYLYGDCGGIKLDNNVTLSYLGIRRDK